MRKGDPSFLFLDGEGMIVSFASLHWDILGVDSVCFLRDSIMSVSMVRVGGGAGALVFPLLFVFTLW